MEYSKNLIVCEISKFLKISRLGKSNIWKIQNFLRIIEWNLEEEFGRCEKLEKLEYFKNLASL